MQGTFFQYDLITELTKKYSHTTYLVSSTNEPGRQLVLNVFTASLFSFPHERENLLQKAQQIKELEHPHLACIVDLGIKDEQPFVVREYLPNSSLRDRLKMLSPDRLELKEALTIVSQVGQALAYAHEHNVLHGNIKPENILFDANNQAILTDFHLIARKEAIIRDQTAQEYAFCYLAPEQFAGIRDSRSDQYALGCLAYELITGTVPFAVQSLASMMGHPNSTPPTPLSQIIADLPPTLDAAVLKSLAKDPNERFFDFSLFLEVIQSVLLPPPAFPLTRSTPSRKNRTLSDLISPAKIEAILESDQFTSSLSSDIASRDNGHLDQPPANQKHYIPSSRALATVSSLEMAASELAMTPLLTDTDEELFTNFLTNEDQAAPEIIASSSTIHEDDASVTCIPELSENAATKRIVSLAKSILPRLDSTRIAQTLPNRKIFLVRTLIISIVIFSIFYVVVFPIHINSPISIYPSTKLKNTSNSPITQNTFIQPSAQPTNNPTVQPSIQATNQPTVQTSVQATRTPSTSPIPTPSPTVIATTGTSYEAEASQNTLAGGAKVVRCSSCSGGYKIYYIGLDTNHHTNGTLQFNNVSESMSGRYKLTIYYLNGFTYNLTGYISVNGGPAITFDATSTGSWNNLAITSVIVSLNAGNNTIEFYNPSSNAPDMDRIIV